jgi:hypothetical protein
VNKLERFGAGMSLFCAVHCAAMPVLLVMLPFLGSQLENSHWAEFLLIGIAASIGYLTLGMSCRRHGQPLPLLLLSLGLFLVWAGHAFLPHEAGTVVAVAGGLTLAGAQLLNRRLTGPCTCAHHSHSTDQHSPQPQSPAP